MLDTVMAALSAALDRHTGRLLSSVLKAEAEQSGRMWGGPGAGEGTYVNARLHFTRVFLEGHRQISAAQVRARLAEEKAQRKGPLRGLWGRLTGKGH